MQSGVRAPAPNTLTHTRINTRVQRHHICRAALSSPSCRRSHYHQRRARTTSTPNMCHSHSYCTGLLKTCHQACHCAHGNTCNASRIAQWGQEYDIEFTRTDYLGKASLYLNVFPWTADQTPWRHADRQSYLEHCQAVAELLIRWRRVAAVKRQIAETDKKPRRGTVPLKTVPLRLDLPDELVKSFRD